MGQIAVAHPERLDDGMLDAGVLGQERNRESYVGLLRYLGRRRGLMPHSSDAWSWGRGGTTLAAPTLLLRGERDRFVTSRVEEAYRGIAARNERPDRPRRGGRPPARGEEVVREIEGSSRTCRSGWRSPERLDARSDAPVKPLEPGREGEGQAHQRRDDPEHLVPGREEDQADDDGCRERTQGNEESRNPPSRVGVA